MVTYSGQKKAEWALYAGLAGICAVAFLIIPLFLDRGIDLTDEGAYLNFISTPGLYPSSLTLFGYFYHPLLVVSSYSIVFLRTINYAALVLLTLLLVKRATHAVGIAPSPDVLTRVLWSAFTTSALFFYCVWLPTPSYNSLNVCGALLLAYVVVGMVGADSLSLRDIVVAGVALSLCALAKPTSGAALAVLLLAFAFRAPRAYLWSIVAAGLLSAILCGVFLLFVHGSPSAIIQSFHEGTVLANGMLGGQSTLQIYLGSSIPYRSELLYAFFVFLIATIIFLATEFRFALGPWTIPSWFAGLSGLLALCIWERFHVDSLNRPLHWTPVLFAITIVLYKAAWAQIHTRHLRVALILLAIPLAIGIGSNTGMLHSAAQAAAIWSVASLFILATIFDREILRIYAGHVAAASVIAVVVVVAWAMHFPQRQVAPLWTQQTWISAHGRERALRVDSGTATYFRALGSAAQANGFSGEPDVIDLGANAATIYVLGGKALGAPYQGGGWSWGEWMAERLLRSVPRERRERAWVITRVQASDTLNPRILRRLGLNFPDDYMPVGHATSPLAPGEQTLWKPKSLDQSIKQSQPRGNL